MLLQLRRVIIEISPAFIGQFGRIVGVPHAFDELVQAHAVDAVFLEARGLHVGFFFFGHRVEVALIDAPELDRRAVGENETVAAHEYRAALAGGFFHPIVQPDDAVGTVVIFR
ncbi:MAG: hypothetical protein WKG03_15580 [Telluria sp.]